MAHRPRLLGLLVASVGMLSGCSSMSWMTDWFSGGSKEEPPMELVEITPRVEVRTLWQEDVGSGRDKQLVNLGVEVSDGRVLVADRDGLVEALDAATGQSLWKVETKLPLSAGPGAGAEVLVLGTTDAELVGLDVASGAEVWRQRASSEVLAVPRVWGGTVVARSIDGSLMALEADSGERRWVYQLPVPTLTLRGSSAPVVDSGLVIGGFASGKLVALDMDSGRLVWETSVTTPSGRSELERMVDIDADPVLYDGIVYVGTYQGDLAAVAEATGSVLWRRDLSCYAGLSVDWRRVYVTDSNDVVWAIDPRNGAALWKQDRMQRRHLSAPALVDDYLVVGDYEGYLHWLSKDDGEFVARTRVGSAPISAKPQVVDEVVYVYGDSGNVAALTIASSESAAPEQR
jgi:outer membrane protein assembly factor BamB